MVIKLNYSVFARISAIMIILCIVFSSLSRANQEECEELPIIMYHHISEDSSALNDYVISPKELESDFLYLKENGYTAILTDDLINFKDNNIPLPEKPVMITFDDGFESVYHYAFPLALKYGMKFVLAIYGTECEKFSETEDHNILYSYMTFDEIRELSESGVCEIANHTYSLHSTTGRRGITRNKNESIDDYRKTVSEDIIKLQKLLEKHKIPIPKTFVYPYGFYCKDSEKLIKELGFGISLTCNEGINKITKDDESLYSLKRYNRPHNGNIEKFLKAM